MKFQTIKKKFNSRLTQEPGRLKFSLGYRRGSKKNNWFNDKSCLADRENKSGSGRSVLIFKEKRCRTICFCGGCRRRRHVLLSISPSIGCYLLTSQIHNFEYSLSLGFFFVHIPLLSPFHSLSLSLRFLDSYALRIFCFHSSFPDPLTSSSESYSGF